MQKIMCLVKGALQLTAKQAPKSDVFRRNLTSLRI